MSSIHVGTMLAYLAGAAVLACAVMAVYWGLRKVPPGFNLWMLSYAFVAGSCLLLAGADFFPRPLIIFVVPGFVLVAAALRLEGLRQYFGRRRLGGWILILPAAALGVIGMFTYAWDDIGVRSVVTAAAVTLILIVATIDSLDIARRSSFRFLRYGALIFPIYGGLWLVSGIHWVSVGAGLLFTELDIHAVVFFAGATVFECFGLVGVLIISARWNADQLEAAHGVTERERRQLADIVAFLPDATFVLDRDRRVVAWNRMAEERTGAKASEVVGARLDESPVLIASDNTITLSDVLLDPTEPIPTRYSDVRFDGDSVSGDEEWRHPTLPEQSGYLLHLARLLRDPDGDVVGTIESARDVTSKVQAADAVRESEERYRSLFDHSLDGIVIITAGGAVVDANPSACRMLGMTREEICAARPGSLISRTGQVDDDAQGHLALGSTPREMEFRRGDGSTFPAEGVSVVWSDSVGHLRSFVQFRDISERVEAENILRATEESLVRDGGVSPMGNWEIDIVSRSVWLSPGVRSIFGIRGMSPYLPLESSFGTEVSEDPAVLRSEIQKVMAQGGSFDVEYFVNRRDDQARRRLRSIGAAVMSPEGMPVKVVGVTQDITESQRVSDPTSLDLYPTEHSDDQVYWIDADGRIVNVNQAACTQLGYTREELLAMTIYELNPVLPPGGAESVETVKAATSRRHETIHRTKDGSDMPVELVVTYATHNEADYKFVVARDISERKRLEENLRRTQLSLGRGGDAILWADEEGRLTFATDAACAKLGFSRDEIVSMNIQDVSTTASQDWNAVWREVLEHGSFARHSSYRTKGGGEISVDVVLSHVQHDEEDYALVVLNDMGEPSPGAHTSAEVDLGRLRDQELEAVGQLAGGIAHDFNNLLAAIIGYGDLILAGEDAQDARTLRKDAEEIRNAAERAAVLTSQILAFARQQPLSPRRVELGELLRGMEPRLRELLTEEVELTLESPREPGVVEVDTEQFEIVVVNLVTNAQEAMPEGGRVDIKIENAQLSEEYCQSHPEVPAGKYVVLSVSDTGVGMDETTQQRIFEPFFTTKPSGEGPGLGLSVVYGVVRQSGGYVVAYGEIDKGSTMKVYLPRLPGDAETASPRPEAATGRPKITGGTILVVEDEAPLRRLMARVLGRAGYRVFVAGSGPEALELWEDMAELPDLLVTDVILPGGLRGNDLADELTSRVPGLPVLYISGHPHDAIMHEGRLDEGVFFLGKPFAPQGLSAKVREILGGDATSPEASTD